MKESKLPHYYSTQVDTTDQFQSAPLDPLYGDGGYALVEKSTRSALCTDIIRSQAHPAGFFVAAEVFENDTWKSTISLIDVNGKLDTSYNNGGKIQLANIGKDIRSITLEEDPHKNLLCLTLTSDRRAIYRFDSTGAVDSHFGASGVVYPDDLVKDLFGIGHIASTKTGYVILGRTQSETVLISLTHLGAINTAFGNEGIVTLPLSDDNGLSVITKGSEELILPLLISLDADNNARSFLHAFNGRGEHATSFGNNGEVAFKNNHYLRDLSIDNNSKKITISGLFGDGTTQVTPVIWRLGFDGRVDNDFNGGAPVLFEPAYGGWQRINALGDRLLGMGSFYSFHLAVCYLDNGTLDPKFVPPAGFGLLGRPSGNFMPWYEASIAFTTDHERMLVCGYMAGVTPQQAVVAAISLKAS
jgi:hypothetical protein